MTNNKLISMVQFILEHPASHDYEWQLKNHLNYANFLTRPLTIGMFIPCSPEGDHFPDVGNMVFFEGFYTCERMQGVTCATNGNEHFDFSNPSNKTIEDLVPYNLTLTESAIKCITT